MIDPDPVQTLVTVTGATGFIALHCIRELLQHGYQVRGTLRDLNQEHELRQALSPLGAADRLTFVKAELLSNAGWEEALQGARFLMHVASPLPKYRPKDEMELIRPAHEGTLRVLRAALAAGVSRVVMTSSMAAVSSGWPREAGRVFDENDWADLEQPMGPYEKSKTLAERAAWEFARENSLELVCMNPVYVLGPSLRGVENASNEIVGKLLRREVPGVPRLHFGLVDVRDVAKAHLLAMTVDQAAGERFILISDTAFMQEIAEVLAAAGYKVPTLQLPNFVVRMVAWFDPVVRLVVHELDKPFLASSEKAQSLLGWSGRSMREMVLDTARSFQPSTSRGE
jgi:dihydroflavonol-4-reductase